MNRSVPSPVLPGQTIGILGNGQLGRMLALSARAMGYRVATLGPGTDSPAAPVSDHVFVADYDDLEAVQRFAQSVDVVTFEFENIANAAAERAARCAPVRPGGNVLFTTQNRLREKTFLRENGFPTAPFLPIRTSEELQEAARTLGLPAVLKTAGFGYDGKGQRTFRTADDLKRAPQITPTESAQWILEGFIDYAFEISVVAARGIEGDFAAFPAVRNDHANHILDVTTAPCPSLDTAMAATAETMTRGILESLDVVGVLGVEFFVTRNGRLLVNELAPRTHNSGHWTIEGAATSQFEQQIRAVCGLPLGSTAMVRPGAAMANLLGDLWETGTPDWRAALGFPDVHLHLYGKAEPRPGRKMGHLTARADNPEEAERLVRAAREALRRASA